MEKMSRTTHADDVACFFGAVKTKRTNTVEFKIADYVKKEDQLRKSIFVLNCIKLYTFHESESKSNKILLK